VGPQGRSGQVRKISPPPGFDPRTVQPVASRYTDHDTRPIYFVGNSNILLHILWQFFLIIDKINAHSHENLKY
jgi:hypothetical protein